MSHSAGASAITAHDVAAADRNWPGEIPARRSACSGWPVAYASELIDLVCAHPPSDGDH